MAIQKNTEVTVVVAATFTWEFLLMLDVLPFLQLHALCMH